MDGEQIMSKKKKPNVLILYSDQHSARALGCYGNKQVHTPNLDKLAQEGVKLEHAYTQNPICTPSRMCMLSGQYVHNFGSYGLMGQAPNFLPTIFSHYKNAGYATGMAGKTHIPTGWVTKDCDYIADGYGFEQACTLETLVNVEGCQGMINDDYSKYLDELGLRECRDDKILQEWLELYGHDRGQGLDARPSRIPKEHSIEAWSAKCTNEFIKNAVEEDKPFCFWMTVPRPHQTYAPSKEFWDLYEDIDIELPPNAENDMRLRSVAAQDTQRSFKTTSDWTIFPSDDYKEARKRVLRGYYACVTQVDDAIGNVMQHIENLGIREDTIIVYTTDHGEFAGEHGMIEKAPGIGFGCVTRIPMIFSWRNHLPEKVIRESIVESIDIFSTLCELCGIEEPNWVDGISMKDTLEKDISLHQYAVTENIHTKTIHTDKYKLTQYLPEFQGEDFGELFDMEADPYELRNLYFDSDYQGVIQDLRYKLYCWLVRSTRVVNANSMCPVEDLQSGGIRGVPWELNKEFGMVDEDGKIGHKFCDYMIKKGMRNYL